MMIKNYQLGLLATKRLAGRKLKGIAFVIPLPSHIFLFLNSAWLKWISGWTLPAIGRACIHQNSQAGAFCEGVRATTTNPLSLHTGLHHLNCRILD